MSTFPKWIYTFLKSHTEKTNNYWPWYHFPIIPTTWEAEVGRSQIWVQAGNLVRLCLKILKHLQYSSVWRCWVQAVEFFKLILRIIYKCRGTRTSKTVKGTTWENLLDRQCCLSPRQIAHNRHMPMDRWRWSFGGTMKGLLQMLIMSLFCFFVLGIELRTSHLLG